MNELDVLLVLDPASAVSDPLGTISLLGAAGALLYVLRLIVESKLHSHSEVEGLRQDKKDLLEVNSQLNEALIASNQQLAVALGVLQGRRDV